MSRKPRALYSVGPSKKSGAESDDWRRAMKSSDKPVFTRGAIRGRGSNYKHPVPLAKPTTPPPANKLCSSCWKSFFLSPNYKGRTPKCPECRQIMKIHRIEEPESESEVKVEVGLPLFFESGCRVAQASLLAKGESIWFDTLLILLIGMFHDQNSKETIPETEISGLAAALLQNQNFVISDDGDSEESESDEVSCEKSTATCLNLDDETFQSIGMLMHEIYPLIGLSTTISIDNQARNDVVPSHFLHKQFDSFVTVKNLVSHSAEALKNWLEQEHTCALGLNYPKYFTKLIELIKIVHKQKNQSADQLALEFYSQLRDDIGENDHWMCSILLHLSSKAFHLEAAKSSTFQRPSDQSNCFRIEKPIHCSTSSVIQQILKENISFSETSIPKPPKRPEELIRTSTTSHEIYQAKVIRYQSQDRRMNLVLKEMNISGEELETRKVVANDVGRLISLEVNDKNSNSVKNVELLCSPEAIETTLEFDYDFASTSTQQARDLENKLIAGVASSLNVGLDCVKIISSIAGSWKVEFQVMMDTASEKKKAGELYEQIRYGNFMESIERGLKILAKKKPTTRIVWNYVCTAFCYEEYTSLDSGLLCTGATPHWHCASCLAKYTEVKFEECSPDIRCMQIGCDAMFVNTHLIETITNFTNNPDFHVQYTAASLMVYKMKNPYPLHAQCEACQYLTEMNGQQVWTCGEGTPEQWRNNGRPCGTKWCLVCVPMQKAHSGPHKNALLLSLYAQITDAISRGFLVTCPKFLTGTCNSGSNIFKVGGCNHMNCSSCNGHFCFVCEKELQPVKFSTPDHPCKQFGEDEQVSKEKAKRYVNEIMQKGNYTRQQLLDAAASELRDIGW